MRTYNDTSELFFLEVQGYSRLRIYNTWKMWASQKASIENLAKSFALSEARQLNASHIKRASRAIAAVARKLEAPR